MGIQPWRLVAAVLRTPPYTRRFGDRVSKSAFLCATHGDFRDCDRTLSGLSRRVSPESCQRLSLSDLLVRFPLFASPQRRASRLRVTAARWRHRRAKPIRPADFAQPGSCRDWGRGMRRARRCANESSSAWSGEDDRRSAQAADDRMGARAWTTWNLAVYDLIRIGAIGARQYPSLT